LKLEFCRNFEHPYQNCKFWSFLKITLEAALLGSRCEVRVLVHLTAGRRFSSGSVDILSRPKIFLCSEGIRARTKDIFVQQKNFSKYSSVTTSSAAEEFRKIFFSVWEVTLGCEISKI
jgi:hypothetical protein